MTDVEAIDLREAFAELGRIRLADVELDVLLSKVTQLAKRTIPGASEVSVTLMRGDAAHTVALTDEFARRLDQMQYDLGHGPCLEAALSGGTVSVPDTGSEDRWPDWATTARQAGGHSSLSIGLPTQRGVTGALNLYATETHAFDNDAAALSVAQTFAGFAAVGLANARLLETSATPADHSHEIVQARPGTGQIAVEDEAVLGDARRLAAVDRARRALPASAMPLDAIAGLAARLLRAPMAVVTFVGQQDEYFAGMHGLPARLADGGQAPLTYSVCKYVVSADAPVCSPDMAADEDPRLREHPLHTEYGVRAFLGVPLRDADDQPVGSLSVLDPAARQWNDADLTTLAEIAHLLDRRPGTTEQPAATTAALDPVALVQGMTEAFVAVDPHGVVVAFNPAAQDLLGWPADEVCGRHLDDTMLPDYDGRPIDEALGRLFATSTTARAVPRRVILRHRDGHRLPAQMVLSVVPGAAGALACAFLTDLSQQAAAESEAERQHRVLTALVDNLDVAVAAIDPDGVPLVLNRALRHVHGIGDDWNATQVWQAITDSICNLDGTPLPLHETPLLRALRGEHVRDVGVLVGRTGLQDRILLAHAQPITTGDGTRLGAVAALHDVTALRRAEAFRACEQEVTHILAAAATVGDAAAALLRTVTEALGWPHAQLWLRDSLTDTLQQIGHWSCATGQCGDPRPEPIARGVGIIGAVWATGRPLWIPDATDISDPAGAQHLALAQACAETGLRTVLAVPIRDGDTVFGVLACYSDAPDQHQDLLTVLVSGVAAQVGLSLALRSATDLSVQLARTRNDFLTLVGHELRTPLTSIISYATLLIEDLTIRADEGRQMLQVIARNAGSLRTIVDDLLDLSGLDAGHLQLDVTEHDLTDIVAAAVAAAEPAAAANGVRLHTRLPKRLPMHGDPHRLCQVVTNLISNAITYSPGGGDVRIRLTAHPDTAELRITDTGIGIPAGEQQHAFNRFYRASNVAHQEFPGAGLGLALVHTITELHHGTVTFDTSPHQPGTSVLVRLPRHRPALQH
ncbi:GAF domain-containing protein [Actinoplanes teichomyceticus]|uniref:histidine kinase n=1 Tax=Actinoplanes teichomyceticus TaxID=1867 RepID=A0A561WBZ2_ACTTI|nr:GAF domain-containing protein [Actinoplanes teichomyceticus]TWG21381.1 PAS domain S-box-containing protein [Actinoplanes teichomyceticus]GIF17182.1 hypothetical protein Ate01nite_72140 [Actinoplanes teichomyceticus]